MVRATGVHGVAATGADAEDADALRVDAGGRGEHVDGVGDVLTSAVRVFEVAGPALALTLGAVMDACTGELAELGLETKEFFVLAEVEALPYPAEIATALLLPRASVTVYVRNLVARGSSGARSTTRTCGVTGSY